MSGEERARRFADGKCLYCGAFYHRVEKCAARKQAQTFKAAGVEITEVDTKEGSEKSGKDQVNLSSMVLWLTENVLF
jgi:hypothetical protein